MIEIEDLRSKIRHLLEENRALTVELAAAQARNAALEHAGPIPDPPAELVYAIRSHSRRPHQPVTIPYTGGRYLAIVDGAGRMPDPRREQAVWEVVHDPPPGEPWLDALERAHLPAPLLATTRGNVIVVAGRLSRTDAIAVWRAMRAAIRRSLRHERPVMSLGALAALSIGLRQVTDTARNVASSVGAGLVTISTAAAAITTPMTPTVVDERNEPAPAPIVERTKPVDKQAPLPPAPPAKSTADDAVDPEPPEQLPTLPLPVAPPDVGPIVNEPPLARPAPLAAEEPEARTTSQPEPDEPLAVPTEPTASPAPSAEPADPGSGLPAELVDALDAG